MGNCNCNTEKKVYAEVSNISQIWSNKDSTFIKFQDCDDWEVTLEMSSAEFLSWFDSSLRSYVIKEYYEHLNKT